MLNTALNFAATYYAAWNIAHCIGEYFIITNGTPTHPQPWSEN